MYFPYLTVFELQYYIFLNLNYTFYLSIKHKNQRKILQNSMIRLGEGRKAKVKIPTLEHFFGRDASYSFLNIN